MLLQDKTQLFLIRINEIYYTDMHVRKNKCSIGAMLFTDMQDQIRLAKPKHNPVYGQLHSLDY